MAALKFTLSLLALTLALTLLLLAGRVRADCTETVGAPVVLASFDSATDFGNGVDDLGGALAGAATMTTFQRSASGYLTVVPATAASAWSAAVPSGTAVQLSEAVGAVVAFDVGVPLTSAAAQFTVSVLTRLATAPPSTPPLRRELPVQPYVPAAPPGGATFATVRVPVQHFLLPINQVLAAVEFRAFAAGAPAVLFDNLRIEYNRCPHRRNVVPLQTCNPSTPPILVDDFSDATRFAAQQNLLGGLWSDDGTMTSVQRLTAADAPRGPGLLLTAKDLTSYWYTLLKTGATLGCVNPWPYTTLRLQVAASVGLQFDVGLTRLADDCVSNSTINAVRVQSSAYTTFNGLTQTRTLDIPLGLLPRNPIKAIALSGFYRPPGAPTDGTLQVVVHSISFVRDCARLATEMTEAVPPILDGCGASDVPLFTLSFDGPGPWVDSILDYLLSQNVKATFFVQPGALIDRPIDYDNIPANDPDFDKDGYPKEQPPTGQLCRLTRRIINEGHDLGDHSYTHPRFSSLYEGQLVAEIERPTAFYSNCLGYKPDKFRPPYGELLPAHVPRMAAQNFTIVQWNLESNDHLILTNPNNDLVANIKNAIESYRRAHGGLPSSTVMLAHDNFTNLLLPTVIEYIRGLGYQFITLDDCRERCIDRAYPGQPAHLADHRGCWDPRNPSDYVASQLMLGQWWLKTVPMSTDKVPGPLGTNYPFMAPPSVPYIVPTILPGIGTAPPPYLSPTPSTPTSGPTTAAPSPTTTAAPSPTTTTAPSPTTTAAPSPTTTAAPSPTTTPGPCAVTGTTLTVRPAQSAGTASCMDVYNAQYHYLASGAIVGGQSSFAASVLGGATNLIVELYSDAKCAVFLTSFSCPVTTTPTTSTTPPPTPTTPAPTATSSPSPSPTATGTSTTTPSGVPSFPPSGLGCTRSGALVYVYNLPPTTHCVQGYTLPSYKLQADAAVTMPPTYIALAGIAPATSLAFEVYSQRAGPGDCTGLLATFNCQA